MKGLLAAAGLCVAVPIAFAPEPAPEQSEKPKNTHADCPMHKTQDGSDSSAMNMRSEKEMRFSQTVTTHHFLLRPDGGTILVEAKDSADIASRDNIRMHLAHIAKAFSCGDFAVPMLVHGTMPPGVSVMKELSGKISYRFEETPSGGRVVIATGDTEALSAIHAFLRFQIDEHRTGGFNGRSLIPRSE